MEEEYDKITYLQEYHDIKFDNVLNDDIVETRRVTGIMTISHESRREPLNAKCFCDTAL